MSSLIPLYTSYSMKDKLKNAQCKWDKINRYWVAPLINPSTIKISGFF